MSTPVKKKRRLWMLLPLTTALSLLAYSQQQTILTLAQPYIQPYIQELELQPYFLMLGLELPSPAPTESEAGGAVEGGEIKAASDLSPDTSSPTQQAQAAPPLPPPQYILKSVALDPFELQVQINSQTVHERKWGDVKQVDEVDITDIVQSRDRNILSVLARRVQKEKTDMAWGKALGTNSFKVWIERRPQGSYYGETVLEIKGPGRLKPFGEWSRMAQSFSTRTRTLASIPPRSGVSTGGTGEVAASGPEKKSVISFSRPQKRKVESLENPSWLFGRWKALPNDGERGAWGLQFGPKHLQVFQDGQAETFEYRSLSQNNRTLVLEAYRGAITKKYRVETTSTYWQLITPEGQTFRMVRDQF